MEDLVSEEASKLIWETCELLVFGVVKQTFEVLGAVGSRHGEATYEGREKERGREHVFTQSLQLRKP